MRKIHPELFEKPSIASDDCVVQEPDDECNEASEDTLDVVFKKDRRDGTVIAFFPETLRDGSCNPGNMMSYEHNGQHGEASLEYYQNCRPCSEEEYADLLTELERIYDDVRLIVKRRMR